ncbi:transglutaminase-like domain-containing protein [Bremerella sp. JC817]|uniref:transglutaminase-like domain-containing protein n=1 Tax=Bremerella sp. JC817 TaxID=3231756 RepID=UPI00345927E9
MANRIPVSRIEVLTILAALGGITAANASIYSDRSAAIGLGISLAWGAAVAIIFLLIGELERNAATRQRRNFPPLLQAAVMCTALSIPVLRSLAFDEYERIDSLLMESMRNLCATSAIFTFDSVRRRATLFVGMLLVLFAFTLESSLVVTLCLLFELIVVTMWLTANDQHNWQSEKHVAQAIPWKWDFVSGCVVLVAVGFIGTTLLYSDEQRKVDERFDPIARQQRSDQLKRDYSFQKDEDEEAVVEQATEKALGADASKSKEAGAGEGAQKKEAQKDLYRQFSTIRSGADGDQEFKRLFSLATNQIRHIPSTNYDQFNGKQWLADKKSQLPAMTAQIADNQGLTKLLKAEDLDYSKITNLPDINDKDFLEQTRTMLMRSMSEEGAGTLAPELNEISPDRLRQLLESSPDWSGEASLVVTHYELQALAERMRSDPELLWKFLASSRGNEYSHTSVLRTLQRWRDRQDKPLLPQEMAKLLETWTAGRREGWDEVMGVVDGLRKHAEYDPQATVPPEETDSVFYFLVKSKRGPDYLFASSAVILLRSLGYPSRLVGGYYAKEEKRSWLNGQLPIEEDDVHYWAQVKLDNRVWVDIEPTPGFEIPSPNGGGRPMSFLAFWDFLADHGIRIVIGLICVWALVRVLQKPIRRGWIYWSWRLGLNRSPRQIVYLTQRLLDARLQSAGLATSKGHSFARAILPLGPNEACLRQYYDLGQQAIYHDGRDSDDALKADLRAASLAVVAWLSPRRLKDARQAQSTLTKPT